MTNHHLIEKEPLSAFCLCSLALLLAYKNGHGQLCRALVTAGANLSICNNESLSIFTVPAASRALLVNILGKW